MASRGRPPGSKNRPKMKEPKFDATTLPPLYKCTKCGRIVDNPTGVFYSSKRSDMYIGNEGYTHMCSDCANKFFEEQKFRFKDEKTALILTCCALDLYFSEKIYVNCRDKGDVSLGAYIRQLNLTQEKSKTFYPFLVELLKGNSVLTDENILRDEKETKWAAADRKNKGYVIQTVGYDCFDDESYTTENRKFLYNTLADYLTDEVIEDPHKLQSAIMMVKTMLQQEQIDRAVNREMRKTQTDYTEVEKYSKIKDRLITNISKMANDNGLTVKSGGAGVRNTTALTYIMREMADNGFEDIKVNSVDAKLSASYKEVAEQNARALIAELGFTSDEYARMVGEQSEIIRKQQEDCEKLQEELRMTKIELQEAQAKGRGKP